MPREPSHALSILPMEQRGAVTRVGRKGATVRLHSEGASAARSVRCSLSGRLFGDGDGPRGGEVVVGDEVLVELFGWTGGPDAISGRITHVEPRANVLRRAVGPPERRELRVFAANIDRCYIVSSFLAPPYRTGFLDRSLVVAYAARVVPVLVFNKLDLAGPGERAELDRDLVRYARLDLEIHRTSAVDGGGLAALRASAAQGRAVFFGHSGVGKTALLAALGAPRRRSGAVDRRGRGRHTTTAAELVLLPDGGEIVDTPGIRALGLDGLTPTEVCAAHPDLAAHAEGCRFPDCSHDAEPDCAVRAAVAAGETDQTRYESLLRLSREAAGIEVGITETEEARDGERRAPNRPPASG